LDHSSAQIGGRAESLREIAAHAFGASDQVQTVGVNGADTASRRSCEQIDGIGMVGLHVRNRPGFDLGQFRRQPARHQKVLGGDGIDASEACDQMAGIDDQPIETEVGEMQQALGLGMAGQIAGPLEPLPARDRRNGPGQGQARRRQTFLAPLAAVEQQAGPAIVFQIVGVPGKVGKQQQGTAAPVAGHGDQRGKGATAVGQRCQRAEATSAQQCAGALEWSILRHSSAFLHAMIAFWSAVARRIHISTGGVRLMLALENNISRVSYVPVTQTIALVDDDRNILTSVAIALEAEGYKVDCYSDSVEALQQISETTPDLAVLDIKMPKLDGMELLTRLRREHDLPVIFLTSLADETDEALGLRMGADDYITKPFSLRLLTERIRAVLRRAALSSGARAEDENDEPPVSRGNLVLDPARHRCLWKGDPVTLTVTEFLILKALALRPGHVKSRDQLLDAAYDENIYVDDRTIDSHIKRVRKKFRMVDPEFSHIETLYGVGYRYKET